MSQTLPGRGYTKRQGPVPSLLFHLIVISTSPRRPKDWPWTIHARIHSVRFASA